MEEVKIEVGEEFYDLDKINVNLIGEAPNKMKSCKSDGLYDFSSDCPINGPLL